MSSRHWLLAVLALVVLAYSDILFLGRGLYVNDLTSYHYPMKEAVREVVRSGGLPLWNRSVSAGQPMAANPAYEVFYPPQWLVVWLPFAFAFQLHILVHFVIAAAGMFLLMRYLGLSGAGCAFGALAFAFGGPYLSLAARLPLLFSCSWMPLALLLSARYMDSRTAARLLAASSVLGLQLILGEPVVALQTWALIGGVAAVRFWRSSDRGAAVRALAAALAALIVASALIAAVQLVPGLDHARDSVRAEPFEFRVVANWSTPLVRLAELVMPSLFRHLPGAEGAMIRSMYVARLDAFLVEIYVGLPVVLLALAGVLAGVPGRVAFVATLLASIILAAGDHTPLLRLLYDLHLFRAVRYPEKFLLTGAFALAAFGAVAFDRLRDDARLRKTAFSLALLWLGVAAVFALAVPAADPALHTRAYALWTLFRAATVTGALWWLGRGNVQAWTAVALALTALDLAAGSHGAVPRISREIFEPPALARRIPAGSARIYHDAAWMGWDSDATANAWFDTPTPEAFWWLFRNGMFPNTAAAWGHEIVLEDDVDLTSLRNTAAFREAFKTARATHVPGAELPYLRMASAAWRLRFPEFTDAIRVAVARDARGVTPVAVEPVPSPSRYAFAAKLERTPDAAAFPYAVASAESPVTFVDAEPFQPAGGSVRRFQETPNAAEVDVTAAGRAFLVASVTGHKYWSATIDGRPARLVPANLAFQGLEVPPGDHTVRFRYWNPLVPAGAAVSLLTLLALAAAAWFTRSSQAGGADSV